MATAKLKPASPDDLILAIEQSHDKLRTKTLDISFNELLGMKESGELKIDPDFQRLFVWSEAAQSRFIETLLLELPVPPIYVVEDQDQNYELIDGLQRLSTYMHFRGVLDAPHREIKSGEFLELSGCDIVKELNGFTWDTLPAALKIRLKRPFIRVEIVARGSDARSKYYMFQRLNTGGSHLSPQNIRNCTIRLLDSTFNDFIAAQSKDGNYEKCISILSDQKANQAFDQELVLRFFALKNWREGFTHDVDDFLDQYLFKVATKELPFDYEHEKGIFKKTFSILEKSMGELSFAQPNKRREDSFTRGFSTYHYEAITTGLQVITADLDEDNPLHIQVVKDTLTEVKLDPTFITFTTGGGKNSRGPLNDRINFVVAKFESIKVKLS